MTFKPFSGSNIHLSTVAWNQHHSLYSPHLYDQNFIEFKLSPFFDEFIEIEAFHQRTTQCKALVFKFPPRIAPRPGVKTYLKRHAYDEIKLNVYTKDTDFTGLNPLPSQYHIKQVQQQELSVYLTYRYQLDLPLGEDFARDNQEMIKQLIDRNEMISYIVTYEGEMVAHAEYILHSDRIELYYIEVAKAHRRQALASHLQQAAKKSYPNALFFAVADADDPAANAMYQSLGYSLSFWFLQFQKVL